MPLRILSTFANRLLSSVFNFLLVVLTAHYLGAEGRGEISLILLASTIIQLFTNIFGGGALVYLVPRYSLKQLLLVSVSWAAVASALLSFVLQFFQLLKPEYALQVFIVGFMATLFYNNQSILLGRQKIYLYNLSAVLQPLLLLLYTWIAFYLAAYVQVDVYLHASYCSFGLGILVSSFWIRSTHATGNKAGTGEIARKFAVHGGYSQLANGAQLLNYRFSYYMINMIQGAFALGIFSTAVSVSEAVWMFGKSIATMQYADTAQAGNTAQARQKALLMSKLSLAGTLFILAPLLILPERFYLFVFGPDFSGIKMLMFYLAPGIAVLGLYTVLANFFSGIGQHKISSLASVTGLLFTLLFCALLIPVWGMEGAAVASSISHLSNALYLMYRFKKEASCAWSDFIPTRKDWEPVKNILRKL